MTIMNKIRIMISVHLDGPDANVDNNDNSYTRTSIEIPF